MFSIENLFLPRILIYPSKNNSSRGIYSGSYKKTLDENVLIKK